MPLDPPEWPRVVRLEDHARVAGGAARRSFLQTSPTGVASTNVLSELEWERQVIERLKELFELEMGWDGFRAKPIDYHTAQFALKLLQHLLTPKEKAPRIVPLSYGGLQLEWKTPHGELEVEVVRPYFGKALFLDQAADEETEFEFENNIGELRDYFRLAQLGRQGLNAASAA